MQPVLLAVIVSFFTSLVLAPFIIKGIRKLKASQTVLHYVKEHEGKSGTPTMGGLIFMAGILTTFAFFSHNFTLALISMASMLAYGFLGFLDDFIKVRFKQNLGLRPYQKIIGQTGIAALLAFFAYTSPLVGTTLFVPFTSITIDIGWGIIPLVMIFYIAVTNSVNLTDGLDGLAGGTSFVFLLFLLPLCLLLFQGNMSEEISNLFTVIGGAVGALAAYLLVNIYPAKIFMGDTGSLALGGLIASLCVFTKTILILPVLGIVFVWTALSVVLQVGYFKATKGKRIFLMAPFHHHLQQKGIHENRIVFIYMIVTSLAGLALLAASIG